MKAVTNFLNPPGANLIGAEKTAFDELKALVDRCTQEILIRPDWDASMQCVDLVNSQTSARVLSEIVLVLKRKLQHKLPKVVSLTLSLAETLVKNGTVRVHAAMAADTFMKEMAKTARKYNGKVGVENREVAELSLDIVQAWGEAFLPRQKQYPTYVRYYHDLRKEGLPFNKQFDTSRVPIFTPESTVGSGLSRTDEDAILAAALAASFSEEERQATASSSVTAPASRRYSGDYDDSAVNVGNSGSSGGVSAWATSDVIDLSMSVGLLKEMIQASSSTGELRSNEIASDIAHQLRELQSRMMEVIEHAVIHNPESIDKLFKLNEDTQQVLRVYDDFLAGAMSPDAAQAVLATVSGGGGDDGYGDPGSKPAAPAAPSQTEDILDMDFVGLNVQHYPSHAPGSSPSRPPVPAPAARVSPAKDPFDSPSAPSETLGMHSMGVQGAAARRPSSNPLALPPPRAKPLLAPPPGSAAATRSPSIHAPAPAPTPAPTPTTADLLDPFGGSSAIDAFSSPTAASTGPVANDPFGPSSIDSLLQPTPPAPPAPAPVRKSDASLLELFNTPPVQLQPQPFGAAPGYGQPLQPMQPMGGPSMGAPGYGQPPNSYGAQGNPFDAVAGPTIYPTQQPGAPMGWPVGAAPAAPAFPQQQPGFYPQPPPPPSTGHSGGPPKEATNPFDIY